MISPSHPAAIEARDIASTRSPLPVAWLGSMTIGRCEYFFTSGITLTSRVFRVYFSNVRIHLSQRMTFGFPDATMYSADISHSSIVEAIPRFKRIGFVVLCPTAFRSSKFCMFRAPI